MFSFKLCFFLKNLILPAERRRKNNETKVSKLLTYGGQIIDPTAYIYINNCYRVSIWSKIWMILSQYLVQVRKTNTKEEQNKKGQEIFGWVGNGFCHFFAWQICKTPSVFGRGKKGHFVNMICLGEIVFKHYKNMGFQQCFQKGSLKCCLLSVIHRSCVLLKTLFLQQNTAFAEKGCKLQNNRILPITSGLCSNMHKGVFLVLVFCCMLGLGLLVAWCLCVFVCFVALMLLQFFCRVFGTVAHVLIFCFPLFGLFERFCSTVWVWKVQGEVGPKGPDLTNSVPTCLGVGTK